MTCSEYSIEKLEDAEAYAKTGRLDTAIARFRETITYASAWKVRAVEAAARERLADLERERGNLYTAESEYRQAIAIWGTLLPPEAPHLALLRGSLAMVCHEMHHYGDADLVALHALRLAEAGADAVSVAIARNNLAALRLMSDAPCLAAEPLMRLIVEPCGLQAGALHNLGVLECSRGRYREAELLLSWAETLLESEASANPDAIRACRENLTWVCVIDCCPRAKAVVF
jgi:tetratricopeptide (TPR) repeat protein